MGETQKKYKYSNKLNKTFEYKKKIENFELHSVSTFSFCKDQNRRLTTELPKHSNKYICLSDPNGENNK